MMPRFASTGESARVTESHATWLPEGPVQNRDINDLHPVHIKVLMPRISQQHSLPFHTPAEVFTSQQMTSPLTYFPADRILPALVIRNPGDDTSIRSSLGHHGCLCRVIGRRVGLPKILWQLPGINYRPHFWPRSLDWLRWKLYTFSQFPLHPSCHHL